MRGHFPDPSVPLSCSFEAPKRTVLAIHLAADAFPLSVLVASTPSSCSFWLAHMQTCSAWWLSLFESLRSRNYSVDIARPACDSHRSDLFLCYDVAQSASTARSKAAVTLSSRGCRPCASLIKFAVHIRRLGCSLSLPPVSQSQLLFSWDLQPLKVQIKHAACVLSICASLHLYSLCAACQLCLLGKRTAKSASEPKFWRPISTWHTASESRFWRPISP